MYQVTTYTQKLIISLKIFNNQHYTICNPLYKKMLLAKAIEMDFMDNILLSNYNTFKYMYFRYGNI